MKDKTFWVLLGLYTIVATILFVDSASAQSLALEVQPVITYPNSEAITFNVHVFNQTTGQALTNTTTNCNFDLYQYNGTKLYQKENISFLQPDNFFITIEGNNFTRNGAYSYRFQCASSVFGGFTTNALEITPSGFSTLTGGQGFVIILPIIVLFLISFTFLFFGTRTQNQIGKWIFFALTGIFVLIPFLLTITIMQQSIFGYTQINQGFVAASVIVSTGTTLVLFLLPIAFGIIFAVRGIKKSRVERGLAMEGDSLIRGKNK